MKIHFPHKNVLVHKKEIYFMIIFISETQNNIELFWQLSISAHASILPNLNYMQSKNTIVIIHFVLLSWTWGFSSGNTRMVRIITVIHSDFIDKVVYPS